MEKKAVFLVIICCLLVHVTVIGSDFIIYHTASHHSMIIYLTLQGVVFLIYPFLGWITDVCITRYRSVLFSFFLMIVGAVPMILAGIIFIVYKFCCLLLLFLYIIFICTTLGCFLLLSVSLVWGCLNPQPFSSVRTRCWRPPQNSSVLLFTGTSGAVSVVD